MDSVDVLITWTPYLLEGFGWNLLVACASTAMGSVAGGVLAMLRFCRWPGVERTVQLLTRWMGHVPSMVLLFYFATLTPAQVVLPLGLGVLPVPLWFKASLALASTATAFTAWNLHASVLAWRAGQRQAAMLFVPNWLGTFLIGVLASTTASLIGVSELVARSGVVISAAGEAHMMAVYAWASGFFIVFCSGAAWLLGRLRLGLARRFDAPPPGA